MISSYKNQSDYQPEDKTIILFSHSFEYSQTSQFWGSHGHCLSTILVITLDYEFSILPTYWVSCIIAITKTSNLPGFVGIPCGFNLNPNVLCINYVPNET